MAASTAATSHLQSAGCPATADGSHSGIRIAAFHERRRRRCSLCSITGLLARFSGSVKRLLQADPTTLVGRGLGRGSNVLCLETFIALVVTPCSPVFRCCKSNAAPCAVPCRLTFRYFVFTTRQSRLCCNVMRSLKILKVQLQVVKVRRGVASCCVGFFVLL